MALQVSEPAVNDVYRSLVRGDLGVAEAFSNEARPHLPSPRARPTPTQGHAERASRSHTHTHRKTKPSTDQGSNTQLVHMRFRSIRG